MFGRNHLFHFQGKIHKGEQIVSGVCARGRYDLGPNILIVGLPRLVDVDPNSTSHPTQERDLAKARGSDLPLERHQVKLEAGPLLRMPPE